MNTTSFCRQILLLLVGCFAITAQAGLKTGDALPELAAFSLEGPVPADLKGKVILLDFWASWCGPCRRSFPAMQALHKDFGSRGFVVVAVSVDEKRADFDKFLRENPVTFPILRDANQKLVAVADVATMPTSFLVDRQGKVRFIHQGYSGEKTRKQYQEQIQALLNETPS